MSFLEVVLGVALLGMVAGTLSLAVGAIGGSFRRQQDRLAAAEIASRLLLMRADDEDSLPGLDAEIPYGERWFRWTKEERPVQVILSDPAIEAITSDQRNASNIDLSRRLVAVTVTTWLSESSGGSPVYDADAPQYTLTRLIDPIAFTTSDSAEERLKDQESIEQYMSNVVGSMSSGDLPVNNNRSRGGGGGGGGGGQSPTTQTPARRSGGGGGNGGGG